MSEAVMRVRYTKRGGHYHCRVFTARQTNYTFANCGELVFDEQEWEAIKGIMSGAEFVADFARPVPHD